MAVHILHSVTNKFCEKEAFQKYLFFKEILKIFMGHTHERPQTFFQGRAKFPGGGQKHTICLKNTLKHTIFL